MKTLLSCIESLEPRIAPASVITFTDVDGDKVKITSSVGDLTALGVVTKVAQGDGEQLQTLLLTDPSFQGANITTTVVKAPGGDGLVNIGYINATGRDLGKITIKGDLGQIDAGDDSNPASAIKLLKVRSLGLYGLGTQAGGGSPLSDISGRVDALKVSGDVRGVTFFADDIGSVVIGGSLIATSIGEPGRIRATETIGTVTIRGDLIGGAANSSGSVSADAIKSVRIGGSIYGGGGNGSGAVTASMKIDSVIVSGDIVGSTGPSSGSIQCVSGELGKVAVGGSVLGGAGVFSGQIYAKLKVGKVAIGGDLLGGSGQSSGQVAAEIESIAGVTVGKSMQGGTGQTSGTIFGGAIGPIKVGGSLLGGSGEFSGRILATDSLRTVTIGGSVKGNAASTGEIHSQGSIGAVKIGGDLLGGQLGGSGRVFAQGSLASIQVGGSVVGGGASTTGQIFTAGTLGPVKIGRDLIGASLPAGGTTIANSGFIQGQRIASVTIGGSIVAGVDLSAAGDLVRNASIAAADDIGSIVVKGSIVGQRATTGDSVPTISARGQGDLPDSANSDVAIKSLTVGGRVELARILAGYSVNLTAVNGDASIGPVKVGGDWIASDLVAGVQDDADAALDEMFGDANDQLIAGGSASRIATIASITIRGLVTGTGLAGIVDHFGFVAEKIGSFRSLGFTAALSSETDVIELSLTTGDVTLREVS